MRCPNCAAEVLDPHALFCSRCGVALAAPEAEATEELDEPGSTGTRAQRTDPGTAGGSRGAERADPAGSVRTDPSGTTAVSANATGSDAAAAPGPGGRVIEVLARQGWAAPSAGALLAFAGLLVIGLVLLIAFKLQNPRFAAGSSPFAVLSGIVVLGLSVLGAPIHFGDLVIRFIPMGALAAALGVLWWAARRSLAEQGASARSGALEGAKLAVPLALICSIAALAFRIRSERDPVFAGAIGSLLVAGLWGGLVGALAGRSLHTSPRRYLSERLEVLGDASRPGRVGVAAGVWMLAAVTVLGALTALLWVIVALAKGSPAGNFGAGDAVAGVIYFLALLPNVVVWIVSLALGAALQVGAGVTVRGRVTGGLDRYAVFDWGGGDAPVYLVLLLLIPILVCARAGMQARRRAPSRDVGSRSAVAALAAAALTFGLPLFVLAALSEARLGPGLLKARVFARIAPEPWLVLVLALLWGFLGGLAGWALAGRTPTGEGRAA